jgi:hypothetical protein
VIAGRTGEDVRYTFNAHQFESVGAGIDFLWLAFAVFIEIPVWTVRIRDVDFVSHLDFHDGHIDTLHYFYVAALDALMFYAVKTGVTFAAGSASTIVATGPAVVSTEVWFLKADIAGGAVVTFAALPAITATRDAHVRVGVALQAFGAGAEWSTLFGALRKAIVGATVGSAFLTEATCGRDAFLNAKALFAGKGIHTNATHAAAAVIPTLLLAVNTFTPIYFAVGLANLTDIYFQIIIGTGIDIAFPTNGAITTRPAGDALSRKGITLLPNGAIRLPQAGPEGNIHAAGRTGIWAAGHDLLWFEGMNALGNTIDAHTLIKLILAFETWRALAALIATAIAAALLHLAYIVDTTGNAGLTSESGRVSVFYGLVTGVA